MKNNCNEENICPLTPHKEMSSAPETTNINDNLNLFLDLFKNDTSKIVGKFSLPF